MSATPGRIASKRRSVRRQATPAEEVASSGSTAPIRIKTRGLTKRYDDLVAVDHLDLDVRAGEIFGLLGQNGAGKTTTISMLLGLTEHHRGCGPRRGLDPARVRSR